MLPIFLCRDYKDITKQLPFKFTYGPEAFPWTERKSDETKRSPSQIHSALKAMIKANRAEHTMNKTLALSLFKKPTRPKKSY